MEMGFLFVYLFLSSISFNSFAMTTQLSIHGVFLNTGLDISITWCTFEPHQYLSHYFRHFICLVFIFLGFIYLFAERLQYNPTGHLDEQVWRLNRTQSEPNISYSCLQSTSSRLESCHAIIPGDVKVSVTLN